MRIGVFGGSFDPVHLGHLLVAECAREQARLDRVLFVPTATQPHKQDRPPAEAEHWLAMLHLAAGGHDAFAVSHDEIDRGGVSYTIDTLERLAAAYPDDRLCLILGPDALASLPTWKEPERIGGHFREWRLRADEILDHDERNSERLLQHPRRCAELLARDEQAGLGVLEHRSQVAVVHSEVQSDVDERRLVCRHEVFDDFAAVR